MSKQNLLNNMKRYPKESGSIIIFTVLMMGSILAITLTLAAIFLPKIKTAISATSSIGAIYAADSGVEWCIYTNRGYAALPQPVLDNGATFTISPNDCTVKPMNNQI